MNSNKKVKELPLLFSTFLIAISGLVYELLEGTLSSYLLGDSVYDVIIIYLPDLNSISLSRLYSVTFYNLIKSHLSRNGKIVTQASSPLYTKKAFWSIETSIEHTGLYTLPYHLYVPSFGEWGFILGYKSKIKFNSELLPKDLKYLNSDMLESMKNFPKDMSKIEVSPNTITQHKLIEYYNSGWNRWYD